MYIIYGEDGKVLKKNITDYIQKGNDDVNEIFLAIEGKTNDEWTADVIFTLPNGDVTTLAPSPSVKTIYGIVYSGWLLSIASSVTVYEGNVLMSIRCLDLDEDTLLTFQTVIVINPSVVVPNETTITYAQYQALLDLVNQKASAAVYKHFITATASDGSYVDFVIYKSNNTPIVTELALRELVPLSSIGMVYHTVNGTLDEVMIIPVSRFFRLTGSNYIMFFSLGEYETQTITITTVTDVVSLI